MTGRTGAVAPRRPERAAVQPLPADQVVLTGGYWGTWQADNATASIPHALTWLRREGVVANLEDWRAGIHTGPCYTDSDLYKTMEAIAWEVARTGDDHLRRELDQLIEAVARAQGPDGYINTHVQAGKAQRWANLADGHELYCIGHLIQAAIAHKRATGADTFLDVASRAADLVVKEFGASGRPGLDGHEGIEIALVELFREADDRAYLEQAIEFIARRGYRWISSAQGHGSAYYQDATPPLEQTEAVGHAVRATYLMTALADVALETGDAAYLAAARAQWESVTSGKWYITGALGSRYEDESLGEAFELPPDRAYGETCAAIGFAMASWRLLLATGESRYADAIERILHNALAASTDVNRTGFFYVNPLQRRNEATPADPTKASRRAEPPATRPPWFETACCPPNVLRTVACVHQWVATQDAGGVQIHQYMASSIDARGTALGAHLTMETAYPDDGLIVITVSEAAGTAGELALRIPSWANRWELALNGEELGSTRVGRGYVRITREWRSGDTLRFRLPVQPRLTSAHPAADALRGTVAIERGPVVYCLEGLDQPDGLDLSTIEVAADATLEDNRDQIAGREAPVVALAGVAVDHSKWSSLWPGTTIESKRAPVRLAAVPYHLWANRGPTAMRVHIPVTNERAPEDRSTALPIGE